MRSSAIRPYGWGQSLPHPHPLISVREKGSNINPPHYITFCFALPINSAVFHRIILQEKLYSFDIQDDRSTHFLCTANDKNDNNINRFYIKNSPLEGTDQSESICDYVEWALSKNVWKKNLTLHVIQFPK